MILSYTIDNDNHLSVKQILKEHFKISDRLLLKLKRNNKILLNNSIVTINTITNKDDILEISFEYDENNSNIIPTKMDIKIIFEDDSMLIVNKAAGVAIHPSCQHFDNSLSNGIRFYFDSIGLNKKVRPVNRLDKDTSGLVIFAKNEYVQECLIKQMKTKNFIKEYLAILQGYLQNYMGIINAPIARKENSIIERCIDSKGEIAITHYEVIQKLQSNLSLVKFTLETGRTHQIRVHSKYIGHPILGDTLYRK